MAYAPALMGGVSAGSGTAGAGALAGAAAVPGLNALLLPLLLSFGPSLIGRLFGDPQARIRKEIARLLSPDNILAETNRLYQGAIGSPGYSQAQGTIATGANQTANQVASNLAQRGLGTTGTGAVLSGLTPSLVGSQMATLRTSAHDLAANQALETIKARIASLTGDRMFDASPSQKLFAGGLEAFKPYLAAFLRSRYPQLALSGSQ